MKPLLAATGIFLVLATAVFTGDTCHAQQNATAPLVSISYTSFQGETFSLYPWYGQKIVLLTLSGSLNATAMQAIVQALDAAYGVYQTITEREPTQWGPTFINGRSTIAEVPDGHTCGAGCAYLGFTGIEIDSTRFGWLYNGYVQHAQYDQVVFYELGRNFWFYGSQLAALDPFVTGFAIANRFISMELAGLPGGPFNNSLDFQTFKNSTVFDLLDSYLADPTLNWQNTLAIGQAPPNPYGWGAADLAGAMFYRIFHENGSADYEVFYQALASLPQANSAADAVNNFIEAAYQATGQDYTYLFCKSACSVISVYIAATDSTATEAGPTTGTFRVNRTGSTSSSLTVNYTVGGSATNGVDYQPLTGSVVIPAGALSATITVTPINDAVMEGNETVVATLSPRPNYTIGSPSSATVTIVSDERVTISATDSTATESGPTTGTFRVSRTGSTASALTVFYTLGGRAVSGTDYTLTPAPSSVTIPAGFSSATIIVTPINDVVMEGNETAVMTLSPRPNYTVGSPSSATVTLVSNERVTISATDSTATEAGPTTGAFRVSRTGSTSSLLTVNYTVGGTATNGVDYQTLTGSVVIPAGASSATITVAPINDVVMEGNETVVVTLSPMPNYTVGSPGSATVTIVSDEKVTITATDPTATESGLTTGTFRVSRSGSTASSLTVFYTLGGTAVSGTDYTLTPAPSSVTIPAGSSLKTIIVTPINDVVMEGNETVIMTLSPRSNYTVGSPSGATVTLVSNE